MDHDIKSKYIPRCPSSPVNLGAAEGRTKQEKTSRKRLSLDHTSNGGPPGVLYPKTNGCTSKRNNELNRAKSNQIQQLGASGTRDIYNDNPYGIMSLDNTWKDWYGK